MKVIDKGKTLDELCEYLNSHKKETGIKIVRQNNAEANLQENKWFPSELGSVEIDEDYHGKKKLTLDIWKGNIDENMNINFDVFKNLLKTFEIKKKVDIIIEMK